MTLLARLQGSYLVQEQEAAERIEQLQKALSDIKSLAEICSPYINITNIVEKVLDDCNQ